MESAPPSLDLDEFIFHGLGTRRKSATARGPSSSSKYPLQQSSCWFVSVMSIFSVQFTGRVACKSPVALRLVASLLLMRRDCCPIAARFIASDRTKLGSELSNVQKAFLVRGRALLRARVLVCRSWFAIVDLLVCYSSSTYSTAQHSKAKRSRVQTNPKHTSHKQHYTRTAPCRRRP